MQKSVSNFMKMAVTLYKVCWAKIELKLSTVYKIFVQYSNINVEINFVEIN